MNSTPDAVMERPATSPYSAKRMAKPVNFYCHAKPDAKSVRLVGDFNDWNITSLPMQRRPDGWWFVQVPLTHGHHQYVFLVDGEPELDSHAAGFVFGMTPFGKVSVIAVS
jgi:1,4-alpha-glucan branching enzyme